MAQKWREGRKSVPSLDGEGLRRAALRYVERYATTRAKLASYLNRKIRERGWSGSHPPEVLALVEQMADLRYVDDAAFASARTSSLSRRGYGPRRIGADLRAAGVADHHSPGSAEERWAAALVFARRKRIGPYAAAKGDRAAREKAFAAMMRAGHEPGMARRIVAALPDEIPLWDDD